MPNNAHYLVFNQGFHCLQNFTHLGVRVNADTMAGVIISRISSESSGGIFRQFYKALTSSVRYGALS